MSHCVWSRNLKNEEAMARIGPQRHRKQIKTKQTKPMYIINCQLHFGILLAGFDWCISDIETEIMCQNMNYEILEFLNSEEFK